MCGLIDESSGDIKPGKKQKKAFKRSFDMEGVKTIAVTPEVHAKVVDHCKNRRVKLPIGDWTAQAIIEKIERETPKEEVQEARS